MVSYMYILKAIFIMSIAVAKEVMMLIKKRFHIFKDNASLIVRSGEAIYPSENYLNPIFDTLILDISKVSLAPVYSYITRHTDDHIDDAILRPFREKFPPKFFSDKNLGLPTVWLTVYCKDQSLISKIKWFIEQHSLRSIDGEYTEYKSSEEILSDNTYTKGIVEAINFPIFLHQITQIAIDLIKVPNSRLQELRSLEWMMEGDLEPDIRELELYFKNNSPYYLKYIVRDSSIKSQFWKNFRIKHRVNIRGRNYLCSWAHFLFNTIGI